VVRSLLTALALALAFGAVACHPGGEYVQSDRSGGKLDRGEVNGRVFDFVSNKPEGDDWTIRVRGTSMFVSYANSDSTDKLGSIELTDKEGRKVWRLVDKLDMPSRKKGKRTEDDGYVTLVLHEPSDDGGPAKIKTIYVPRDNDIDEDVTNLAAYLVDLVKKYKQEAPHL
jgi:hypothetical protein